MRIDYANGGYYEGETNAEGKRHGHGRYTYADGSYYVGEFKNGRFHG